VGRATYSDLGYRLLGELLEAECGVPWTRMGRSFTGLQPAPWKEAPVQVPPGGDREAWAFAAPEGVGFPVPSPKLPHDGNARAGMRGHAGFGATPEQLRAWLPRWVSQGWGRRMAVPTAIGADGAIWGLGLQAALEGPGRFGALLSRIPEGIGGVQVLVEEGDALAPPAPAQAAAPGPPTGWWYHTGFTGPLLAYRPSDGCCLALLCHRRGPEGELLDPEALRHRRWRMLEGLVEKL